MNKFVFVSCQVGAEKALKQDLSRHHSQLSFAFSRPGFVTFKVADEGFDANQPLRSVFARTFGLSVGSIKTATAPSSEERLDEVIALLPQQRYKHLHVWNRDAYVPGERKFEPFHLPASLELGKQLKARATELEPRSLERVAINRTAKQGDMIADLVIVEPDHWFVGWHRATGITSRWPGGVPPLKPKEDMVSRAYLKMQEALRWSKLPAAPGDLCIELGSSPGGSCQALLERDMHVIGIDPAKMDERVVSHPNFTHVQARMADLKRAEFATARWLVADTNVAPATSLDAIEHIVTNRRVNIHGLLVTLKPLATDISAEIDQCIERVRTWGYRHVRARQLAFNRREVCLFGAKSKGRIRFGRKRKTST